MKEIWKDIKGYEGLYEVSNLGRIRSVERKVIGRWGFKTVKESILKQGVYKGKTNRGYNSITLSKNNKMKTFRVHKLVAEHFISKLKDKPCINHIDNVKTNNRVDNLEWCTYQENTAHMYKAYGRETKVAQYDLNESLIKIWNSITEASKSLNIGIENITACCHKYKNRHTAGGYIWKLI